jgi:hypothetical protein
MGAFDGENQSLIEFRGIAVNPEAARFVVPSFRKERKLGQPMSRLGEKKSKSWPAPMVLRRERAPFSG